MNRLALSVAAIEAALGVEMDVAEAEGLVFRSLTKTMISRVGRPARREPVRGRWGDQAEVRLGVTPGDRRGSLSIMSGKVSEVRAGLTHCAVRNMR